MAEYWMLIPACRMWLGVDADASPGVLAPLWGWDYYSSLRPQAAASPRTSFALTGQGAGSSLSLLGRALPAEGKRCPR